MFENLPLPVVIFLNIFWSVGVILIFIGFKKYMRVGRIVLEEFILAYGFLIVVTYFIAFPYFLPNFDRDTFFFIDFLGIFSVLIIAVYIFNVYQGNIDFYEFLIIDLARRTYKKRYYYVYNKDDDEYVIHFEYEDRETVKNFLKRLFGVRIKVVFTDDVLLYLKNEYGGKLYFLDDIRKVRSPVKYLAYNLDGELKEVVKTIGFGRFKHICMETILEIDPVAATGMTELEFIVNYERYLRLSTENAELTKRLILAEEMIDSEVWKNVRFMLEYIDADEEELKIQTSIREIKRKREKELEALEEEESNHGNGLEERQADLIDQRSI